MRLHSHGKLICLALALALVVCGGSAMAQQGASTIRGTAVDQTGAVMPGVKVKIVNLNTNLTRQQQTTAAGTYSFELIPPGDYKVEFEAQGFKKKVVSPVHALVGAIAEIKGEMEVGDISSVVEVEAVSTAVQINTQDATLGNNIVHDQIIQLPMEARNVQALLTLQPGVTSAPTMEGYVAGARSDQSNVTLDGVDINESQNSQVAGTGPEGQTVLRLNSEAIEEFRVTTVNASANQGHSSAAQINLVTKSGTNQFHGSLFEYHRNTIFTANDFFNNRSGVPRPKLIRNVFGGTVGGPIFKDKLFFFYSYEGRRDASQSATTSIVPLPILGTGQMIVQAQNCNPGCGAVQTITLNAAQMTTQYVRPNGTTNQMFSVVGLNAAAISVLQQAATKYPANDTSVGDGLNTSGFRFNASTPVNLNSNVAKVDWHITNNMTAFVRLNFIYDLFTNAGRFPDTPSPNTWVHPYGGVASHTWTISKNWVNNFRYGFTRLAFSDQGDSAANNISFRFVFSPLNYSRTLARTTPVHNIVNDTSWIHGSHTVTFGTSIHIIRNSRVNFANAFDSAITNPSFYQAGGKVISTPISEFLTDNFGLNTLVTQSAAQNAATALIGRYSQYSARFTFGPNGQLLSSGTPTDRIFGTEEYEFYAMDTWKLRRNLTITAGLRYDLSRPVHEMNGFGVVTDIPTEEYLKRRIAGSFNGTPYNQPLVLNLAGGDGKGNLYNYDKNNFQPRIAAAWSPHFENSLGKFLFGEGDKSVIRGGYGLTNDYYGQALAVLFDLNNTLGFTSNTTISANTYNITTSPAPAFTGFNQQIRPLPGIIVPGNISFPRQQPADLRRRIEGGLDTGLVAPLNHMWNATIERQFRAGLVFQVSYIGRYGRHLLAQRDVMALNNLRDPGTGLDWYTAATALEKFRQANPGLDPTASGASLTSWLTAFNAAFPVGSPVDKYFSHFFPNIATLYNNCCSFVGTPTTLTPAQTVMYVPWDQGWGNDWTDTQDQLDFSMTTSPTFVPGSNLFFNPQYGALAAWGTIGNSAYNGMTISLRQRWHDVQWDFNYTYSHSRDDASGLQNDATYGSSFIVNPLRQHDWYADSDFDVRHQINFNFVYQFPFGRGKRFGSTAGKGLDAFIGGWQLSGIYRWNTGLPIGAPYDDVRWATNWNVQSNTTQFTPVGTCSTRGNATTAPKLFGCNTLSAYYSFRNAYPGESGMRNVFRLPNYVNLDLGLSKSFTMPWNERHKLQLRWEVFNVSNTQRMGVVDGSRTGFGLVDLPVFNNATPPHNWSNFTGTQTPTGQLGAYRVMQIGARFEF